MPIVVDGQTYQYRGLVDATKGSGDSTERLSFTVYTGPDGRECWLGKDKEQWYLCRAPAVPSSSPKVIKIHEVFIPTKFEIFGKETPPVTFSWVALEQRQLDETEPFHGTDQAMLMGAEVKLAIPLLKEPDGDVYFGPNFPAADIPRRQVIAGTSAGPRIALVLLLALAGVMAFGVWAKSPVPIRIFWWVGPILGGISMMGSRHSFLRMVCGLLSGVFFFHFATHGLDYLVTHEWEEEAEPLFESARVVASCLLFLGLRALWPRFYLALVDGSNTGGGAAWLIYLGGQLLVASGEDAENYFSWFNWYASIPLWSWFWPICLILAVVSKFKDYRKAPVDRDGFRSLLYRTCDIIRQGLENSVGAAKRLEAWADDLEDALSLSAAPAVRAFTPLAPSFLCWREQTVALQDVEVESLDDDVRQALETDLATISEDFKELLDYLDGWPNDSKELKTLRYSPRLVTWNY